MKSDTDNGIVEAWVDGTLVHSYMGDVNHGEDFADFYLQGDKSEYTPWIFSNIIISNNEIGMDENVDLAKIPAFRYENIGLIEATTRGGVAKADNTISKTGYALQADTYDGNIPIPCSRDIWIKLDFYSENNEGYLKVIEAYGSNSTGIGILRGDTSMYISNTTEYIERGVDNSGLHTIIMHMVSGKTDGIFEYWMDGEKKYSREGIYINDGVAIKNLKIHCGNKKTWVSNIIISNRELTFDDDCKIYEPFIQPSITSAEELGVMGESDFAIESNIEKIVDILNGKTVYSLNNNHYIKFFIKKPIVLRRINLRTRILGVALQYSDDGENWTDCGVGYNHNGIPYVDCTEDKPHQYFRMNIIKKHPVYSASDMLLFRIDAEYAQF